jgi:hypothetical protein
VLAFTTTRIETPGEIAWGQGAIHIKVGNSFRGLRYDFEIGRVIRGFRWFRLDTGGWASGALEQRGYQRTLRQTLVRLEVRVTSCIVVP